MIGNIKCLIVDDEPLGRDVIVNFCSHFPPLEIIGDCANALEARNILQENQVHLMFLDIQMPVLNGMSFYKTLKNPPLVIFTTAYKEYATHAFDVEAVDYLVKPFSLDRFIIAIDRLIAKTMNSTTQTTAQNVNEDAIGHIFIKAEGKIFKFFYDEILYAEANGNYTNIITNMGVISPTITFTSFGEQLSQKMFIRVHRSFIINRSKIKHIEGNIITIDKFKIPVGNFYREAFLKAIGIGFTSS